MTHTVRFTFGGKRHAHWYDITSTIAIKPTAALPEMPRAVENPRSLLKRVKAFMAPKGVATQHYEYVRVSPQEVEMYAPSLFTCLNMINSGRYS